MRSVYVYSISASDRLLLLFGHFNVTDNHQHIRAVRHVTDHIGHGVPN